MKAQIAVIVCLMTVASSWVIPAPARPTRTSTSLNMFGGAAAGGQNNEEAEAQAKAMGMSVKEYQIAMRMRENLATALNNHRSTGGTPDCQIVHDGNCIVKEVKITDSAIAEGKEKLEAAVLKAWGESFEDAKAATQREFQALQKGVAEEMKGL